MSLQTYFQNEEQHYVFDVQRQEIRSLLQLLAMEAEPIIPECATGKTPEQVCNSIMILYQHYHNDTINVYSNSANFQCQDLDINNVKIKNNYN